MNTILPSVITLLRNSKRSLMYVSIAAITMGVQELFESVVFSCPCEGHFAYGMTFLFLPALILFFAWNSSRWHVLDPYKKEKTSNTSPSLFRSIFYHDGGIPSSSHRSHGLAGSVLPTTEALHMRFLWPAFEG